MNRYKILCTEAQTRKALGLGAPIINQKNAITRDDIPHFIIGEVTKDWTLFLCPTAEQMIGWLEEQGMQFNVHSNMFNEWEVLVYTENTDNVICEIADSDWNKTKKEATLAAIDVALVYLENLKQ